MNNEEFNDDVEVVSEEQKKEEFEEDWKAAQEEFDLSDYKYERHKKFAVEAYLAGFEVRDYQGRASYDGPAVVVEDLGSSFCKLIRATSCVSVKWDNLGYDWIVYPG